MGEVFVKVHNMIWQGQIVSSPVKSAESIAQHYAAALNLEAEAEDYGVPEHLALLDAFYHAVGAGSGKFTSSGCTVGECKLWAYLHIVVPLQPSCLARCAGLRQFYDSFAALPETQGILNGTGAAPGKFAPLFSN